MNRTDRLLAIVLELQARKSTRAEDLTETFGVTKRTIYRDVQALCEAGVPVVSLPGQGYALVGAGVTILRPPSDGRFGRQFTFVDPDGYAIIIYDRDAPPDGWEHSACGRLIDTEEPHDAMRLLFS